MLEKGIGLTELLITLGIMAILANLALPEMMSWIEKHQAKRDSLLIASLIAHAKENAITLKARTAFCPLDVNQQCSNQWNEKVTLFTDYNNNKKLDSNEKILAELPAIKSDFILRKFNNSSIGFNYQGFAGFNTGNFTYCLKRHVHFAAIYTISRSGRIRVKEGFAPLHLPQLSNGGDVECAG
ncbi:MAG: GspH/FimT family pseudopilin [Venatoribacter sp.]